MTLEKELISKSYYQTLLEGNRQGHSIQVLGEMYLDEKQNEVPDLSSIRFAQGEVYYLNKDFEAAIFKWENISDDLKPWAQKNIGDAHCELNLLGIAEEYYKAVETESLVLKTEVLLQLFSLYVQLDQLGKAVNSIKKAVELNPDYPNVTETARIFFEEHQDWDNAVELAVNEAIRTESLLWYGVLEGYIMQEHTVTIEPDYFSETLVTLYNIDQSSFESLSTALWNSYKQNDLFFPWLKEFNNLLQGIELESSYIWKIFPELFKDTYFELINGKILIRDFSDLIPDLFTNWMKISKATDALISSSAVLSWNELFPSQLEDSMVKSAKKYLNGSIRNQSGMEDVMSLYHSIMTWAELEGLFLGERFEWIESELQDLNNFHLLIAGEATSGKSNFVNMLLDEDLLDDYTSATVLFKNADHEEMHAITNDGVRCLSDFEDFRQTMKDERTFIRCNMNVSFLNENKLVLIDTPGIVGQSKLKNNVFQDMYLADSLLFVLNANSHLTGKELDMAVRIKEQAPEIPIHFILWNKGRMGNNLEEMEIVERTTSRIDEYFPNAKVIACSEYGERRSELKELSEFIRSITKEHNLKERRTSNILFFIKKLNQSLLEKRVEVENSIIEYINWNEEIVTKLKGTQNQLSDMAEEKVVAINKSYHKIKDELRQDLMEKIPELLRSCSEMVKEDSDFGKLHVLLNNEMNKRITNFMEETVLPDFKDAIQGWVAECEGEFKDSQVYLEEMSASFNQLYGEDKLALGCDFKVLDDWRRDVDRMTRGTVQLDKANILLRTTPSQLLLKSAGKLFGTLSKNNEKLHNKYKHFIEHANYSQTAKSITDQFMLQFELFEKSLERDINMFFTTPFEELNRTIVEAQNAIEKNQDYLSNMRKNPENYRDPLTLFELKLRQYEWIHSADKRVPEYS